MWKGKDQTTIYLNFSQIHCGQKTAKPLHVFCEKINIENTHLQKMHFSPKNWEPTEKNMASNESRDPEETMCEIWSTQINYFARKSNLPKG